MTLNTFNHADSGIAQAGTRGGAKSPRYHSLLAELATLSESQQRQGQGHRSRKQWSARSA